jgi:glycosyltransferase involved in cell wall biosynthesis
MKVVHMIATLDVGGAEKQLITLCKEQVRNGYDVLILPLKGSNTLASEFTQIGGNVSDKVRNKSFISQYFRILIFLNREKKSVIHVHSAKAQLLISLMPFFLRNRFVVSKHDAMQFVPVVSLFLSRLLWRWVQFRCKRVVGISEAIFQQMNHRHESINTKKSIVSYYGISQSDIEEITNVDKQKLRNSWGVAHSTFVIGTVGRLIEEKNQEFMIEVFAKFLNQFPNSYLVICGHGPLEKVLRQRSESLGISNKISILDNIGNAKEIYAGLDLFVLPSLTEGFGLVLLEAMSAELPIIASRVGAIPEVLGMNYRFMFNSTNPDEFLSLLILASNVSIRKKMANETTSRLKIFTSEAMFERIDAVYRSLRF